MKTTEKHSKQGSKFVVYVFCTYDKETPEKLIKVLTRQIENRKFLVYKDGNCINDIDEHGKHKSVHIPSQIMHDIRKIKGVTFEIKYVPTLAGIRTTGTSRSSLFDSTYPIDTHIVKKFGGIRLSIMGNSRVALEDEASRIIDYITYNYGYNKQRMTCTFERSKKYEDNEDDEETEM